MLKLSANCISRRPKDLLRASSLQSKIPGLTTLEAQLLASRGQEHEYPRLQALVATELQDLAQGAQRLYDALRTGEQIVVVCDYDCDGATAGAIMVSALRALGACVDYVVPDRLVHGYGISPSVVDLAREAHPGVRVLVTVDNGILGHSGIDYAGALGIDTVVTDHHLPGLTLPQACAVIDPSRVDCASGLAELAGCGVALWLALAVKRLCAQAGEPTPSFNFLLPYAAIGTVADLVTLGAANRQLVRLGLQMIRRGEGPLGIQALIAEAGLAPAYVTTTDISFALAPRINAAGRLASMRTGIDLLLSTDKKNARALAAELSRTNEERKVLQRRAVGEAAQTLALLPSIDVSGRHSLVAHNSAWHPGVIGLVASKLKEQYFLPTFVFTESGGAVKGSGRSIPGFHLKDALEEIARSNPGVLKQFGGHAMAAGVTLTGPRAIPTFEKAFEAIAASRLTDQMLARVLESDGELPELTPQEASQILCHPWGQRFPAPAFDDSARVDRVFPLGASGEHWKIQAKVGAKELPTEIVLFNHDAPITGGEVQLYLQPSLNTWNNETRLQWIGTVLH